MPSNEVQIKDIAQIKKSKLNISTPFPDRHFIGLEHIGVGTLQLCGLGSLDGVSGNKFVFSKGDILFGKLRPYFRKVVIAPFDGACSTEIWVVKAQKNIDQRFLFYVLASQEFIDFASQGSKGTRMPRACWDYVSKFKIPAFSFSEQKAIAEILGALDDKIELNRKMNETLEEIAQALFKSWFIDFDPVHAKARGQKPQGMREEIAALFPDSFEESELGRIPKGWRVSNIGRNLKTVLGGTPSRNNPNYWKGGVVPWINSGKTKEFRIITPTELITEEGLSKSAAKIMPKRTTVIAITGATLGQVSLTEIECCANQSVIGVLASDIIPSEFIYFWVKENIKTLVSFQTGGAQQHINNSNVNELSLIFPNSVIVAAYLREVQSVFDKITLNCFESENLKNIRDTLLPKLLSGEISVENQALESSLS